jgi:polygalacturonase
MTGSDSTSKLKLRSFLLLVMGLFKGLLSAQICNIEKYGSCRGDGKTNCSSAIAAAIADCYPAGTVLIPPGGSYLTWPFAITDWNGGGLQVDGTLLAPPDPDQWPPFTKALHFVRIVRATNFSISGAGAIDGSGAAWWAKGSSDKARPPLVGIEDSTFVSVTSLTLKNSPRFHLPISSSSHVMIDSIHISAPTPSPNTDGVDIGGQSSHVTVQNCRIVNGDDGVAVGGGASNILVQNNYFENGHGTSIGSIGAHFSCGSVSNVSFRNNIYNRTSNVARIKTWQGGCGTVKNISYYNLTVTDVKNAVLITQYYCPSSQHPGACRNYTNSSVAISDISIQKLHGTHLDDRPGQILCSDTTACTGLRLADIDLERAVKRRGTGTGVVRQTGLAERARHPAGAGAGADAGAGAGAHTGITQGGWFVWNAHGVASNVTPPLSLPSHFS